MIKSLAYAFCLRCAGIFATLLQSLAKKANAPLQAKALAILSSTFLDAIA